ncbi:TatD family hydrolase [Halocatena salina]|uniref:TatD family hydrolase n=1 Tax=Halocatena salina TaxID=2934340 RepID=A0A8U0ABH2_9EURY|nr:TatD family hydrolase [Halocatena salina]UPM45223.1 TatD family hydrolase [Halocatena salina]
MDPHYPTNRPIDAEQSESTSAFPTELMNIPWIDIHNHAHTLSWNDREKFALSGCESMVMMAAAYYWTPYKPVEPEDVQYLWDDALNRLSQIKQAHVFDAKLGVGIHTGARVDDYEVLLERMPAYCALDAVAAVGEIGITSTQHVARWPLEEQKQATRRQMEIADDNDIPAIAHTPPDLSDVEIPFRERGMIPGYELDMGLQQPPVIDAADERRAAIELDIECKDEAGLPDDQLVLSHADQAAASYVMESTDCYLSYTVSYPWLLGVTPRDVATVIEKYGPDRVLVETDSAGILRSDVFAFKRTIFELYRLGIDLDTIRQVVYENPRDVLNPE